MDFLCFSFEKFDDLIRVIRKKLDWKLFDLFRNFLKNISGHMKIDKKSCIYLIRFQILSSQKSRQWPLKFFVDIAKSRLATLLKLINMKVNIKKTIS